MSQYSIVNVKLSNSGLDRLTSDARNGETIIKYMVMLFMKLIFHINCY